MVISYYINSKDTAVRMFILSDAVTKQKLQTQRLSLNKQTIH